MPPHANNANDIATQVLRPSQSRAQEKIKLSSISASSDIELAFSTEFIVEAREVIYSLSSPLASSFIRPAEAVRGLLRDQLEIIIVKLPRKFMIIPFSAILRDCLLSGGQRGRGMDALLATIDSQSNYGWLNQLPPPSPLSQSYIFLLS